MVYIEHAMLGLTLAVAAGTQRRHGPALPATAALAAMLPDWDAVSLLYGKETYVAVHRTWGHNLLLGCGGGAIVGALGYLCRLSTGIRRRTLALWERLGEKSLTHEPRPVFSPTALLVWMFVGTLAGLSHLATDMLYPWDIPLLWPFDERRWHYAVLDWSERGLLVLFLVEMFALFQWRKQATLIAWLTLLLFVGYVSARAVWMRLT
jgi:membrane-bound metal-dependent hydrolase YbcI (DUF457 family)